MEIRLLKDHNGWTSGSVVYSTPEQANYLVRCNVAEYIDGNQAGIELKKDSKPNLDKK